MMLIQESQLFGRKQIILSSGKCQSMLQPRVFAGAIILHPAYALLYRLEACGVRTLNRPRAI